jgi:hypothetical protein
MLCRELLDLFRSLGTMLKEPEIGEEIKHEE